MPWRDYSIMEEKLAFINEYRSGAWSMIDLCESFSISRTTGYKYLERYREHGIQGLLELSREPHSCPHKTAEEIEEGLIRLRKEYPRYGAEKLHTLFERRHPGVALPSIPTINNILKRNGLIVPKKRIRRIVAVNPLFDPSAPNEIWSADYKGKFRLGDGSYLYPLTIADSFSRYVFVAKGLYHPTFEATKAVFTRIFREYGLPLQIHTDNGSPFAGATSLARLSLLAVWFIEEGIDPVYSDPGHPEQNGRHERMHRELKAEVARPSSKSLIWQQRRLNSFVSEYNTIRPHKALGNKTPAFVHIKSIRQFKERVEEWDYPSEYTVRKVYNNGAIRWGSDAWITVATPLNGKHIGLYELGNGIWRVYFRNKLLGHLDERSLRINDLNDHRGHRKV